MTARGLLIRLKEYQPEASSAERNIIKFVRANPFDAANMSIRDLAEATFTSPSTVVRLCRKLGCSGYKVFQRGLVYETAAMNDEAGDALDDIVEEDATEQIIRKVVLSNIRSIEATARMQSAPVLEECARQVLTARVVNVFGIGQSQLVAHDLETKLMRIGIECHAYEDWHNQLLSAKNMRAGDLAIAISYSGLTEETTTCAKTARERGAKVVAITRRGTGSPLEHESDWVLQTAASEPLLRSAAMASRMSQLAIIDVLYAVCVTSDYERCSSIIKSNAIKKG